MSRFFARTAFLACALLAFSACDSNDDDGGGSVATADEGEGRAALSGDLSGTLSGSSYASFGTSLTGNESIYVAILDSEVSTGALGSYIGDGLAFSLFPDGTQEGTYSLSLLGSFGVPGGGSAEYSEDAELNDEDQYASSGTVTLTTVSSTRVIGSFDIVLEDLLDDDFEATARGNFNATLIDDSLFD